MANTSSHMNTYLVDTFTFDGDDLITAERETTNEPIGVNKDPDPVVASPNQGGDQFIRSIFITPDFANSAEIMTDYGHDFIFDRVWIQPLDVDLQFIVEDLEREIKIWNAWRIKSIQVTNVAVVDQEGTDLIYPTLPHLLQKFADTVYTLEVYQDGPPLQNTIYTLTIDGDDFVLTVTGIRIIPLFMDPNWEQSFEMTYEFSSTIFSTDHLKEQRRPLSDESWFNLIFSFDTQSDANRKLFNILSYGHDKVFGVPVYNEKMTATAIGTTSIDVSEDLSYYYNLEGASYVMIVDHVNAIAEIKEIDSIASGTINFNQNIAESFTVGSTYVYPCVFAILNSYSSNNETDDFDVVTIDLREYKN